MKPWKHALISSKKFGGLPDQYLPIHNFFDESKAHLADIRHRSLLHSSWGIWLVERVFGTTITNSKGKKVSVRDIGEQHVLDDMGCIPTVERWLRNMRIEPWMGGRPEKAKPVTIQLVD